MKKLLICFLTFICASFSFAELKRYDRKFEFGIETEAGASNNFIRLTDLLVKDLVIDLEEVSNELSDGGFIIDFNANVKSWFALNFNEKFRLNFFWGIDGSGYTGISKNFFDLFCKGFEVNSSESIDLKIFSDVYVQTGATFKTKIKDYGVHFTPTIFAPVIHVTETKGTAKYTSNENGLMRAEADLPLNLYSVIDLEGIDDKTIDSAFIQEILSELVKSAGFDFSGEVERSFGKILFTLMVVIKWFLYVISFVACCVESEPKFGIVTSQRFFRSGIATKCIINALFHHNCWMRKWGCMYQEILCRILNIQTNAPLAIFVKDYHTTSHAINYRVRFEVSHFFGETLRHTTVVSIHSSNILTSGNTQTMI